MESSQRALKHHTYRSISSQPVVKVWRVRSYTPQGRNRQMASVTNGSRSNADYLRNVVATGSNPVTSTKQKPVSKGVWQESR
jgi:hypothetical protein